MRHVNVWVQLVGTEKIQHKGYITNILIDSKGPQEFLSKLAITRYRKMFGGDQYLLFHLELHKTMTGIIIKNFPLLGLLHALSSSLNILLKSRNKRLCRINTVHTIRIMDWSSKQGTQGSKQGTNLKGSIPIESDASKLNERSMNGRYITHVCSALDSKICAQITYSKLQ